MIGIDQLCLKALFLVIFLTRHGTDRRILLSRQQDGGQVRPPRGRVSR